MELQSEEAAIWAIRLFLGREPNGPEEVALHRRHGSLESLRKGFAQTSAFRRFYAKANGDAQRYAAPLFLLKTSDDERLRARFEPPTLADPASQLCTAEQFGEPAYRRWCGAMATAPNQHRKQWEFCYILAAAERAGALRPGARALGFGTGKEPIPSVLAKLGLSVVATDAPAALDAAKNWAATRSRGEMDLHRPAIVGAEEFRERVSWRPVDMNAVPPDLLGFDLCWSACSLEHLGSIGKGLDFVANAMRCLRPGGVAVHTTEFNLASNERTLEKGPVCLFRKRDIEALCARLIDEGHEVWPLNLHPGFDAVDEHIDLPPFSTPHLKLQVAGHTATSIGVVARRRA